MTESPITPGPFTIAATQHDAIRAQIETLNAITAYYASITATPKLAESEPTYTLSGTASAKETVDQYLKVREHALHIATEKVLRRGGVIYPTKVETINTSRGPEAAITFAWTPDQPHRLDRNEAMKLRDQLSQFLLDSAKQLSPEVKP